MKKYNYKEDIVGGTLASGGTLGTLLPPSTPFILYGIMTETSIGSLFAAGVVPGILMALCFCGVIFLWCKKDPDACPPGESYSMMEKLKALKGYVAIILVFALVLGGMFTGITSVTEAAALGASLTFLILVIRRRCTLARLKSCLFDTLSTTGMVMLIIVGAGMFGTFLTVTGMPVTLAKWIQTLDVPPMMIIITIIIMYGIIGTVLDMIAVMLLSLPIFIPVLKMLEIDFIWFGVIMIMIMNMGAITPPVGLACIVSSSVMGIPLGKVMRGAIPFLLAFLVSFILILAFPQLSLWLPGLVRGG